MTERAPAYSCPPRQAEGEDVAGCARRSRRARARELMWRGSAGGALRRAAEGLAGRKLRGVAQARDPSLDDPRPRARGPRRRRERRRLARRHEARLGLGADGRQMEAVTQLADASSRCGRAHRPTPVGEQRVVARKSGSRGAAAPESRAAPGPPRALPPRSRTPRPPRAARERPLDRRPPACWPPGAARGRTRRRRVRPTRAQRIVGAPEGPHGKSSSR